ncbi:hypothetical protein BDQ94DRAFT_143230 [Aspergillus welwitschiae]|uniref:Uncharacterized protein n=1 Tax=Aspergillus welwitschiae TaxID=1341132 RepID=A0A3F3Q2W7_9EURO|nr:hypothetical protein BDQ94DRAFT_143230 [Aspergillus welwitschiae]RDH33518.1 hypothetical protein BDQ94DRAFT_143230 [Aspergillus welwitschiae]
MGARVVTLTSRDKAAYSVCSSTCFTLFGCRIYLSLHIIVPSLRYQSCSAYLVGSSPGLDGSTGQRGSAVPESLIGRIGAWQLLSLPHWRLIMRKSECAHRLLE